MFEQLKGNDRLLALAQLIWDDIETIEGSRAYISKRNGHNVLWDHNKLEKAILLTVREWGFYYLNKSHDLFKISIEDAYWSGNVGRLDYLRQTRNNLDSKYFQDNITFMDDFDSIKDSWPTEPVSVIEEVGVQKALIEGFVNNDQGYLIVNGITKNSDGNRWSFWGKDMQERGFWPAVAINNDSYRNHYLYGIAKSQDLWKYYEEYKAADEAKAAFSWVNIKEGQFTFLNKEVYTGPLMVQCVGPYSDGSYKVQIGDKTYLASGSPLRGDLREYYYSRNTSYYAGYHGGS